MSTRHTADSLRKLMLKQTSTLLKKRGAAGMPKVPKANRYAGFPAFCVAAGLPEPVAECPFHPVRKWRFDFAWPEFHVSLECEGAIWTNGGHSRGSGKRNDHEKFTNAAILGWRILYCQPSDLITAQTIQSIRSAIEFRK